MIIRCTECQTRFKLADDKMKPAGVRVRCTKCNTVFTALPPESPGVPAADEKPTPTQKSPVTEDFSDLNFENQAAETGKPAAEDENSDQEFDFGDFNMEGLDEDSDKPINKEFSPSAVVDGPDARAEDQAPEFDIPDFSFTEEGGEQAETFADKEAGSTLPPLEDLHLGDDDFGGFDADESATGTDTAEDFSLDDDEFSGFDIDESVSGSVTAEDFSLDDEPNIGGDLGLTLEDESPEEELPELDRSSLGTQEFSFDDFSDEPLIDSGNADLAGPVEFSFDGDDDPFALVEEKTLPETTSPTGDEFIFEDEPATEQKEAPKFPIPASAPPQKPVEQKAEPPQDKRPARPLQKQRSKETRPKRRKKESAYRSVLVFLLLLLVAAAGYSYFGWSQGTYQPAILIERAKVLIKGSGSNEQTGQIDIRDLRSQFVANQNAGNLFVVHGYTVNHFNGARSTISVRGIIYDTTGKAILQQTAYCGNPLDEAALRTLPFAKIEEAMNNQFGEALSNLNIDPGQSIPFTIVFRNIPNQVAEFNVELADSRPGTR